MEKIIYFLVYFIAFSSAAIIHPVEDDINYSGDHELADDLILDSEGYVYNKEVKVFYKLYTEPESWYDSGYRCERDNAYLAMPKNAAEAKVLSAIFNSTNLPHNANQYHMWINFNDVYEENKFVVQNLLNFEEFPLEDYYHEWQVGEPNDAENEDCGVLDRMGKLNDYDCYKPCVFVCQKDDITKVTIKDSDEVINKGSETNSNVFVEKILNLNKNLNNVGVIKTKYTYSEEDSSELCDSKEEKSKIQHDEQDLNLSSKSERLPLKWRDFLINSPFETMPEDSKGRFIKYLEKDSLTDKNRMRDINFLFASNKRYEEQSRFTSIENEEEHSESNEYVYNAAVNVSYKMHTFPKKWGAARSQCLAEGGVLAMPKNKDELNILMNMFDEASLPYGADRHYMWLRFHDMFRENEYVTDEGIPIEYFHLRWQFKEPNNSDNEDCGAMVPEGKINDVKCDRYLVYICQKEDKPYAKQLLDSFRSENSDKAYVLEPHSGKRFKLHTNPKPWHEARSICQSEGGRLAVINSKEERIFLREMFNDPLNEVTYSDSYNFALLGFHDLFEEGNFVLTTGEPLESLGYVKWAYNEPNNGNNNENCGSMSANGELNDFSCDRSAVFFCEKPPLS